MNEKTKWENPSVIFVKPSTNKESRDIIQRLHDVRKTEFYNYCQVNKSINPFYSVILLADIVPLNKLFGKDYVFCIHKIEEQVFIIPAFIIPPSFKIKTYKEFMETDTFELLGSFTEMNSINREAAKLIESGIDLPTICCECFDKISSSYLRVDNREQLIWLLTLCYEHGVITITKGKHNEYIPKLLRNYIIFNEDFKETKYFHIHELILDVYDELPNGRDALPVKEIMKFYDKNINLNNLYFRRYLNDEN